MPPPPIVLPPEWLPELERMRRWIRNFKISGKLVSGAVTGEGVSITIGEPAKAARPDDPSPGLWAKVASNDDGDPAKHAWTEQSAAADGGWTNATGGRTGTTTDTPLVAADGSKMDNDTVVWAVPVTADDGSAQYRAEPEGGGGIDLQNNGTTAVTGAGAINIPSSSDVLVFAGDPAAGTLSLAAADTAWKVLTWNGTKWVADWVRAHA